MTREKLLLIGEVYIDYSIGRNKESSKMRLGGIVHAARGLWAIGEKYSVAVICPTYLVRECKKYLLSHGCSDFFHLGKVKNSPNVMIISDIKEIGDQGYEDLARDEKEVEIFTSLRKQLKSFNKAIIFPGAYSLQEVVNNLPTTTTLSLDIAYGLDSFHELIALNRNIDLLAISTSSNLFDMITENGIAKLLEESKKTNSKILLLKENRGGSRVYDLDTGTCRNIPAFLGETVNSVGVGDVYTAVMASFQEDEHLDAAKRGAQVATCYAQTTFPDDFKRNVSRELKIPICDLKALIGISLPWDNRRNYPIYLAAPDFSYIEKSEIDEAIASLKYHNFNLRRPIIENGELTECEDLMTLRSFYYKDIELLKKCRAVLAIPLDRDPGTLVEIGYALSLNLPVITYDPRAENNNTMVIGGSYLYTDSLDTALNGIFDCLSKIRRDEGR